MAAPRASQVRGMLLEEALLYLLRKAGYKTVNSPGNDPTLCNSGAGIALKGRGGRHQIDAIADYMVQQPFSNPQRLLVEAKFLREPVGIPVARNAVGVLKDVQEFWHEGKETKVARSRYHYTYAIFSARGYKKTIQKYAFAQDIYLLSLVNSAFMRDIIDNIDAIARNNDVVESWWPDEMKLIQLRKLIRTALVNRSVSLELPEGNFRDFLRSCYKIDYGLLALINGRFPVFLAPAAGVAITQLEDIITVRPRWDDRSWYLYGADQEGTDNRLFSFDLPEELAAMYAKDGVLTAQESLNLKQAQMGEIQAIAEFEGRIRVFRFQLDNQWIEDLLARTNRR